MYLRHKVVSLANGKADTIERTLVEVCQTCKISLTNVVGFGSDGAAVMVGKASGVATCLKTHNAEMISIYWWSSLTSTCLCTSSSGHHLRTSNALIVT